MSNLSKTTYDFVDRTNKGACPLPRFVFSLLRAIDPFIQYAVIYRGYGVRWISRFGITTVSPGQKGNVLIAMAVATAVKHSFHVAYIQEEKITYYTAISIGILETVANVVATLSSIIYGPSEKLGTLQYIGITLFAVGLVVELTSELQRKRFKDNPAHKGQLYSGGLFSLARHINYGGYTLYNTGFALTSGNYWLAAFHFFFRTCDFTMRAIPCLNEYCGKKYGDDWKKFQRNVPYMLFPFVL